MDECQNVIDFEELEKLCSIELQQIQDVEEDNNCDRINNMGQSESKKGGKIKGPTKGESISFGFRKKPASTGAIKKHSNSTNADDKACNNNGTGDDNGNTGALDNQKISRGGARMKTPVKDASRSNRYGFRNTVRPASVGLTPKLADFDAGEFNQNENFVNNNTTSGSTASSDTSSAVMKRRSKSASTTTRNSVTFSDTVMVQQSVGRKTPQPARRYQNQQNFEEQGYHGINSSPQPCSNGQAGSQSGKFTLHTTSLPKPQQPVAVNVPTRSPINTKGLKHAMNMSRREFFGLHDSSSDINSPDVYSDTRLRGRNLEMVLNGRHKFEVRDLERLTSEPVVNLALPKLPSVFQTTNYQPAPLGGLVRSSETFLGTNQRQESDTSIETAGNTEEEKLIRDNNSSEKSMKANGGSQASKNSTPGSSRHSWCNAGETMAPKECSSVSNSSDEGAKQKQVLEDEDVDISSITIDTGNMTETSFSGMLMRDNREVEEEVMLSNEFKFAETAANLEDANLLDDETSPTDSLVSSSSDSEQRKNNNREMPTPKLMIDIKEEKDLEDISPELEALSPFSPGTPTHASNSLSLSDVGRDFLIDDEIADQPELIFDDETKQEPAPVSLNDTPTLRDVNSLRSQATPPRRPRVMGAFESPVPSRKSPRNFSRTCSLDTLSPCESIASDDMMMDFELNTSVDSIERRNCSESNSNPSLHSSVNQMQLLQDLEQHSSEVFKDWSLLLRAQRNSSRESVSSQLPSRTRLLTRRLNGSQTPSQNGSDSPRSVESLFGAARRSRPTATLQSGPVATAMMDENNMELIDKAQKNSILQDVVYFKKQLLRLRRVLQEDDESNLMTSDTLNPFEANGTSINPCTLDENRKVDELLAQLGQPTLSEDQRQEFADLRRQVVYLQSQIDDRDRTIRMQQNLITKYETAKEESSHSFSISSGTPNDNHTPSIETTTIATQTERLTRPLSMGTVGADHGLASRSELPVLKISSTTAKSTSPASTFRKQTQISSVYTQLSSIKPSGLPKHASPCKTVRTTHIGNIPSGRMWTVNGGTSRIGITNHKSSPELRTTASIETTCVGQSSAAQLHAAPLANGNKP